MKNPVEKQGASLDTCKINKLKAEFIDKIQDRFEHDGNRKYGFLKVAEKGAYIIKEKEKEIMEYIQEEYHEEIYENLKRIWNGEKVTKNMREKLNTWQKDGRTNERFLLDTVSAWLGEDFAIITLFKSTYIYNKYSIKLNGTDQKRMIRPANECTREPDLKLVNKLTGEVIYLEVMEDNYGHMKKYNNYDVRFGKYDSMLKLTKKENSNTNLMILDVKNNGFVIIPVLKVEVLQYKYFNKGYKKDCTQLGINYKKHFKTFEAIKNIA